MKTINPKITATKFVVTDKDIYRLTYESIKSKSDINGILAVCDRYDKENYCCELCPSAKSTVRKIVYLKNKNECEIFKIIDFLSKELVFPNDMEDIIEETILIKE